MSNPPAYFERIRRKAEQRWDQLEQDPELAGPWHQLFKQVQSPRHILSELLQNADDAGATEAVVRIHGRVFEFEHNGEDFLEEHFASLCRFGYSNKRALHTIGFRGVGFKSTFSLGNQVELFTPSLSISFDRRRFTQPKWLQTNLDTKGCTRIRVEIADNHRQRELEKNLEEWVRSPVSLLFFKSIRRMRIGDHDIHWGSLGPGPVQASEWMALQANQNEEFLLVRSEVEAFPEEALAEIRQERMLGAEEQGDFPPCNVEIVLGAKGRLFVVLPTGVETALPFASNAPFIQDPARLKIKDPETSPTNRWLLNRTGQLAASAMLQWLASDKASLGERASAYRLLPDVNRSDSSLEGACGTIVEEAFAEAIDGQALLLTDSGQLTLEQGSIIVPGPLLEVWPSEQAAALLDEKGRPPLCKDVDESARTKLLRWDLVEEIDKEGLLCVLKVKHLPKPRTWRQLMILWAYIAPEVTDYRHYLSANKLLIVPVQGREVLYAASEVVRLGEKKLLQSDNDWEFLAKYLIVLNQNWPRFLAEQRRSVSDESARTTHEAIEGAYAVLEQIGLNDTSDVSQIIDRVSAEFYSQKTIRLQECIQLAQIAAKLGAKVGNAFRYATENRQIKPIAADIIFDEDGTLAELVPEAAREEKLLHADYSAAFKACSRDEWLKWLASGSAGLLTFIPLVKKQISFYGKSAAEQEARKRGSKDDLLYSYVTTRFILEDWDFDDLYWRYWMALAAEDRRVWTTIVERILSLREAHWTKAQSARILHVATTGSTRNVTNAPLLPSWVLKLREQACLLDTHGFAHKPADLLRRTVETEPLIDVEPFVHARFDREATRPLLDLLGVRSTPTGPDRILDRLRALAKADSPPIHEVEKWYRRLDQMMDVCPTVESQKVIHAFRSEKLILSHDGTWMLAAAVFLSPDDEDVPDAATIRPSVSELTLWRKIGVSERPTADLAIQWLKALPSGKALSRDDGRRVRALLSRHPLRVWEECNHWINLVGEWVPAGHLSYALTMQSLVAWQHLHPWAKQKTADLQRLAGEATSNPPFSEIPLLAARIEERFQQKPMMSGQPVGKEWLVAFGQEMSRVVLEAEEDTLRVRGLAKTLAGTIWSESAGLEVIPYIDGTPAGTPRRTDVVWLDNVLYVDRLPKAKLARRVPEEVGKSFGRQDIKAALDYSFERPGEDVREYLHENFTLIPAEIKQSEPVGPEAATLEIVAAPAPGEEEQTVDGIAYAGETTEVLQKELTPESELELLPESNKEVQLDRDTADTPRRPPPMPAKPSIIERFAKRHGFKKEGEGRFFHEDGAWIGRTSGALFSWEHRTARGEVVRYYLPKDHCLEQEPLQIQADVWALIESKPESYALILADPDGGPIEVTGAHLRSLLEEKRVILFPASYRLVYDHNE